MCNNNNKFLEKKLSIKAIFKKIILQPAFSLQILHPKENNDCVILFAIKNITVVINNKEHFLKSGHIVFGKINEIINEEKTPAEIAYIILTPRSSDIVLPQFMILNYEHEEIANNLLSFINSSQTDIEELELIAKDLQIECNSFLQEKTKKNVENGLQLGPDMRLIKLHRFIRKNYDQHLSLESLAKMINCNPVYLCNTFKKIFGITPMKLVQKLRMEAALLLIQSTNKPLKDISLEVGFYSVTYFSSLFKKYFGKSPRYYKNSLCLSNVK